MEESRKKSREYRRIILEKLKLVFEKILSIIGSIIKFLVFITRESDGLIWFVVGVICSLILLVNWIVGSERKKSDWMDAHRDYKVMEILPLRSTDSLGVDLDTVVFNSDRQKNYVFALRGRANSRAQNIEYVHITPITRVKFVDTPGKHELIFRVGNDMLRSMWRGEVNPDSIVSYVNTKRVWNLEIRMPKKDVKKYVILTPNGGRSY